MYIPTVVGVSLMKRHPNRVTKTLTKTEEIRHKSKTGKSKNTKEIK
jgi:hypothetical protein